MTDTATEPAPEPTTALVVLVPEADPVVGRWRDELDPSAAAGMAAHITVLYPWLPPDRLPAGELGALREIVAEVPAFDLELVEFGRFPRTLWLAPAPSDPLVRLTLAVQRRWPDYPPYAGRFPSLVHHLSIGDAVDPEALGHVVADVAPQLPLHGRADAVTLMVREPGSTWSVHSTYPLAG